MRYTAADTKTTICAAVSRAWTTGRLFDRQALDSMLVRAADEARGQK
jgi:hypothetical protein